MDIQMRRARHEAKSAVDVPTKDDDVYFTTPEHLLLNQHKKLKMSAADEKNELNPHIHQQKKKVQDDVLKISQECIECDAKDCETCNPLYRCSRCQSVYYCSKDCQRKHWKAHKQECAPVEEMRASFAVLDEPMPENKICPLEKGTVECGICLQDPYLSNPVILSTCQHVFCYLCIKKWKIHQDTMRMDPIACCPYCRVEIPEDIRVGGLDDQLCDRVLDLAKRAERREQGSDERNAMCEEALEIVNQLIERKHDHLRFLFAKANVLIVKGGHSAEVVNLVSKILAIDKENKEKVEKIRETNASYFASKIGDEGGFPCMREFAVKECMEIIDDITGMLPHEIDMQVMLLLATAHEQDGNWKGALAIYDDLFQKAFGSQTTPSQSSEILIGMSRCFYELGMYEDSIYFGMEGLADVSRSHPGAHKYPALSMKASTGRLDSAINLMNQAVLYEAPGNDKNKLEALNLYNELRALKANSLKNETSGKSEKSEKNEKSKGVVKESIVDKLFRQTKLVEDIESGNYPEIYEDDDDYDEEYDDNPYYFHYNTSDM